MNISIEETHHMVDDAPVKDASFHYHLSKAAARVANAALVAATNAMIEHVHEESVRLYGKTERAREFRKALYEQVLITKQNTL